MPQAFKITIAGRTYAVEVDLTQSPVNVMVDGTAVAVEVERPRTELASRAPTSGTPARAAPRAPARAGSGTPGVVTAPMPGKILSIKVQKGEAVSAGQELLTLEAMKMEQAIRAPAAGTVRDVKISAGTDVTLGQALVELDLA